MHTNFQSAHRNADIHVKIIEVYTTNITHEEIEQLFNKIQ